MRTTRSKKYLVVIERGPRSYGAFVPDLPGCVAVATTVLEVRKLIREAIELHLLDMRQRGLKIPKPAAVTEYVAPRSGRRRSAA